MGRANQPMQNEAYAKMEIEWLNSLEDGVDVALGQGLRYERQAAEYRKLAEQCDEQAAYWRNLARQLQKGEAMNNLCPDCGQDHGNGPAVWPAGTEVKSKDWLTLGSRAGIIHIKPGDAGKITGHTEDGRPLVIFEGCDGAHSFHYPETALELVDDGEYWPEIPAVVSDGAEKPVTIAAKTERPLSPSEVQARIVAWVKALNAVRDGLNGHPFSWTAGELEAHRAKMAALGLTFVTTTQAARLGFRLKRGAKPVGNGYFRAPISRSANLYVLECQCVKESEVNDG